MTTIDVSFIKGVVASIFFVGCIGLTAYLGVERLGDDEEDDIEDDDTE